MTGSRGRRRPDPTPGLGSFVPRRVGDGPPEVDAGSAQGLGAEPSEWMELQGSRTVGHAFTKVVGSGVLDQPPTDRVSER